MGLAILLVFLAVLLLARCSVDGDALTMSLAAAFLVIAVCVALLDIRWRR